MRKQQLFGWKTGSINNHVPDFGDVMDADCSMVNVQDSNATIDALPFSAESPDHGDNLPLSPGAILALAEQEADEQKSPSNSTTHAENNTNEHSHLDYLFQDWVPTDYPLTHDPETFRPYDVLYDRDESKKSDRVPISETLQAARVFEKIDARVIPEPKEPGRGFAEAKGKKKRKRKSKAKKKVVVDAEVETLERWEEGPNGRVGLDYGKLRKEQRKRFEKMGIRH